MRQQALTFPHPLLSLLLGAWLTLAPLLGLSALVLAAPQAQAAEILQVTGPDRLLIGDRNRSTAVRLGCLAVAPEDAGAATDLLRHLLPRHRRVNLRPLGVRDGELLARLTPIDPDGDDPAESLVAAGLAAPVPCA